MKSPLKSRRPLGSLFILLLVLPAVISWPAAAQDSSRTFPETGQTVSGPFLAYWTAHGGLAQQGYPISEELLEVSDLDGKPYRVQYFERAVFEQHPENQPPFDVLLSQLGTFQYKAKYGAAGAPGQVAGTTNPRLFPETGKTLAGTFRAYWEQHGGLAQQGYPISNEFQETSPLDGKVYTVQYFERAVFELHPENAPPFDVLLSQLGTFRYQAKYQATPTATALPTRTAAPAPTNTPVPTAPAGPVTTCTDIPPSQNMRVVPNCIPLFEQVGLIGEKFQGDNEVGVYATMPNGQVFGAPFHVHVWTTGETQLVHLIVDDQTPYFGIWTVTMEGVQTHRKAFGYFRLIPQATPAPGRP
ncbi:MAG TPA: hypothetical protein VF276_01470 [Chloroflexia bacterium]